MTILVLASQGDLHADSVVDSIKSKIVRIDPSDDSGIFEVDSEAQEIVIDGHHVTFNEITGVYCRVAIEAFTSSINDTAVDTYRQWEQQAALRGTLLQIPANRWINYPWFENAADGKIYPLIQAKRLGIPVPPFIVTNNLSAVDKWMQTHGQDAVIKPISDASIAQQKGQYVDIPDFSAFMAPFTTQFNRSALSEHNIDSTPFLVQKKIDKLAECRVVVVDDDVFATQSIVDSGDSIDVRLKTERIEATVKLSECVRRQALRLRKALRLRFVALDFLVDHSDTNWLVDVNPGGNWLWQELQQNLGITSAIRAGLMKSSSECGVD